MIVFNLWGALFVLLGLAAGAMASGLSRIGFEPVTAGVAAIAVDLFYRARKQSRPWRGAPVGDVLGDLFDMRAGGMLMLLPVWLWGVAAIVLGVLLYSQPF